MKKRELIYLKNFSENDERMEKNFLENVWRYEEGKLYKKHKQSKEKWICLNELKPKKKDGYIRVSVWIGGKMKLYYLNRLVYLYHNPEWDIADTSRDNSVDHKNQNKLDNRIENLNLVNHSQNMQNKSTKGGKEIKGVLFYKHDGLKKPWAARWNENGKQQTKFFETEAEALAHRAEMVEQHYYQPLSQ